MVARPAWHHVALLTAVALLACGSDDEDASPAWDDPLAQEASPDASLRDAGPVAPYLVEIKANGTGCPQGSWKTAVSPDGTQFRATFGSYAVEVSDGRRAAFQDCNLSVRMRSDAGFSFAVTKIAYSGFAFLEPGVKGFHLVNAYFSGAPVAPNARENRTDLVGPVDRRYQFENTITPQDQVWSPCGRDRNLTVATRLGVTKSQNQGAGLLTVSAAYYPGDEISWQLATRPCVAWVPDAGTAGNGSTSMDAGVAPAEPATPSAP